MATRCSILAWKIPWTDEPGGYSPWGHKDLEMTEQLSAHTHTHIPPPPPPPPPPIHVMYQCSKTGRWLHKGLEIVITAKLYPMFLRLTIWIIFWGANFYC